MMANKFREHTPARTYTGIHVNYRLYKPHLAKDFSKRCGYTDCIDFWFGGPGTFHIDHFIPWKKHPENPALKTDYNNLVYCCSYVNILKSDDEGHYIDPCNVDYNNHFTRSDEGRIIALATSPAANKMYKQLKLYMIRYELIWKLEKIQIKMSTLRELINKTTNENKKKALLIAQGELGNLLIEYMSYLQKAQ